MPPRRAKITPVVDPSQAMRGLATIQGGVTRFTGALAGVNKGGSRNAWAGLASAVSNSGLANEFSIVTGSLAGISDGLDRVYDKSKRKINIGATLTGAGVIGATLGGIGEQLASPLEAARAQLDQSIRNAGGRPTALGKGIDAEQKKMERLGFTYADTDSSLSKLVPVLGSGKKAIAEEGLVADIAARNHTDLSSATDIVIKAYGKSPMALRAFGINLSDTTAKGKAAVSAQKAHGKAQDDLSKARERLAQLEARLGASSTAQDTKTAKQRQANAAAVGAARDELAAAGQHLQDVETKLQGGHVSAASAQVQLESAQNRVAAATKRLTDAEGKGVTVTGLSIAQQQELANARGAVDDAQKKATLTGYVAATTAGDLNKANLTSQQILDLLTKKTHGLAQAQAQTFGGDMRKWKASIIDFGATFGEKFAKPMIEIGPALAGLGAIIQTGFFGKVGGGISTLVRGVGSLGRSALSATGIVSKAAPAAPEAQAAGALDTSATQLDTAAAELRAAAADMARAAAQLTTAAGEESGAAGALDTSATGLDTAAGGLDGAGAGLEAAGTGLDGAGGALDSSATALDTSAAELKGAGVAGASGGAAEGAGATAASRGAGGVLGGLSLPDIGVTASKFAGPAAVAVAIALLSRKPGNKAEALSEYAGLAKQIHGGTIDPTLVPQVGAREKVAWPGYRFAKTGYQDPRGKFHKWSHTGTPKNLLEPRLLHAGYAAGGVVTARTGGVPVLAAEGGQDEIIGSAPTIVAALRQALDVQPGRQGPHVAHYHEAEISVGHLVVHAADLSSLLKQLEAKARRQNFAGYGAPGGSDL